MRLISILLLFSLFSNLAFAECDFSEGIKKNADGSYTYSAECHRKVGDVVADLKLREEQIEKLNKTIELKDLALDKAHERINSWQETNAKLDDRLNGIERSSELTKWIFFGAGILFAGGAVWAAGQLR